jgi:hypothetical protein
MVFKMEFQLGDQAAVMLDQVQIDLDGRTHAYILVACRSIPQ